MERVKCMLEKFLIRPASIVRTSPLTFHENEFYNILKRRIREQMHNINQSRQNDSKVYIHASMLSMLLLTII